MNNPKAILLALTFQAYLLKSGAQIVNWNAITPSRHMISITVGLDHSASYSIEYTHKPNESAPLLFNAGLSMPFGNRHFDDLKAKAGVLLRMLNNQHVKGSVSLHGIFRTHENRLVRHQNFGTEVKGIIGYYSRKTFIAAEAGFDKAIVTHFKHSRAYREEIYAGVVDGWYGPATGGHFKYGLQTGYSLKQYDLLLNFGQILNQDFKTRPMLPFYVNLGLNYRWL